MILSVTQEIMKLNVQILNEMHVLQLRHAVDALVRWASARQLSVSRWCMSNVGRGSCLSIDGIVLPVDKSGRDLGVLVSHDLSTSLHISNIVVKAHKRSAAI